MNTRTRQVVAYFGLAFALTWLLLPLVKVSLVFALAGLFGPAVAALIVTWRWDGREGLVRLLRTVIRWRVGLTPYLIAIGLPIAISTAVALTGAIRADSFKLELGPITPVSVVLFVMVVGEELGWRGFAQPALAQHMGVRGAALLVGLLWGLWHLPLFFMEGTPQRSIPLAAFLLFTVSFSVVAADLWRRTAGSALLATILHGSFNMVTVLAPGLTTSTRWWLTATTWAAVALVIAITSLRNQRTGLR